MVEIEFSFITLSDVTNKNPFLQKSQALTYFKSEKRDYSGQTGLVCECCYHMCTIEELEEYCVDKRDHKLQNPKISGPILKSE